MKIGSQKSVFQVASQMGVKALALTPQGRAIVLAGKALENMSKTVKSSWDNYKTSQENIAKEDKRSYKASDRKREQEKTAEKIYKSHVEAKN